MKDIELKSYYSEVIHGGQHPDPLYGGVSVPIYQSSTFSFKDAEQGAARFAGKEKGYIYTRIGNPTINALENSIAYLERGYGGLATSSGMSALTTILTALLDKDSHMIGTDAVYGPSRMVVQNLFSKFGVTYDFVDTSNLKNIEGALRPNTKLLFVETPANPTLSLTDIAACADLTRKYGITFAVDNTFASPVLQKPLELGADIVYHSVTKFINGHSDVVGGIIVPKEEAMFSLLLKTLQQMGGNMDPHQAWLVLRGVKTLAVRVEKSQNTALKLAQFLQEHPRVEWVNYPGLKTHKQHDLAKKQMKGFGAMITFGVKGGFTAGKKMINAVQLATLAVSLGGVESLIQHPASMTHAKVPTEAKLRAGITDDLIRLAVGCEGFEDLRDDLDQALNRSA